MYQKGDVEVFDGEDYYDDEDRANPDFEPYDRRKIEGIKLVLPFVRLPHSCDSWVIGSIEQVDEMIEDLQAARAELVLRLIEAGNPKEA